MLISSCFMQKYFSVVRELNDSDRNMMSTTSSSHYAYPVRYLSTGLMVWLRGICGDIGYFARLVYQILPGQAWTSQMTAIPVNTRYSPNAGSMLAGIAMTHSTGIHPCVSTRTQCTLTLTSRKYFCINHGEQSVFQFEIIINVLVSSYGSTAIVIFCNSFSAGTVFRRQNLTSIDVRFWRL